jgi:aryl-alcohol dehydrogenase-like predicted oxidoreductase
MRGSLQRLKTDKVDLMQFHNVRDPNQDLGMLRDWKAQGLCRYIGITTTSAASYDATVAILEREKPDFLLIDYAIDKREIEARVLPAATAVGAAVVIALPFGKGRLFRGVMNKPLPDWASEFDCSSWAQFFLKFVLGNPAVTVVSPGTNNPVHMMDDLVAGRGRMPDEKERARMVQYVGSLG